jgi:hypothetical protein
MSLAYVVLAAVSAWGGGGANTGAAGRGGTGTAGSTGMAGMPGGDCTPGVLTPSGTLLGRFGSQHVTAGAWYLTNVFTGFEIWRGGVTSRVPVSASS